MANLQIGVTIRTETGTYQRISEDFAEYAAATVDFYDGLLVYPDRRVERFQVYVDGVLHTEYEAIASENLNLAYAEADTITLAAAAGGAMPVPGQVNAEVDHDGNKVLASSTFQPRDLRARRVYAVGNGPNDTVLAFGTNAEPVSEGQFGSYPLYALCRGSIYGLTPGTGDIAFDSNEPVSTERGAVGRYAVAAVDNVIFFASRDGVYYLAGQMSDDSISSPISTGSFVQAFAGCLGADTALGAMLSDQMDRREVWVASGVLTFVYSVRHGEWSILDRARNYFKHYRGTLYGVSKFVRDPDADPIGIIIGGDPAPGQSDGRLYDEAGDPEALVEYGLLTAPMHLQRPGVRKRIWRLALRQHVMMETLKWKIRDVNLSGEVITISVGDLPAETALDVYNIYGGQANQPRVELVGEAYPGQGIVGFELEFAERRPHRPRQTITRYGSPSSPGTTPFGFDCASGIDYDFFDDPVLHLWDVRLQRADTIPQLYLWDVFLTRAGATRPVMWLWDVVLKHTPPVGNITEFQLWDVRLAKVDKGFVGINQPPALHLDDVRLTIIDPGGGGLVPGPSVTPVPSAIFLDPNFLPQAFQFFVEAFGAFDIASLVVDFDSSSGGSGIAFPFTCQVFGQALGSSTWTSLSRTRVQTSGHIVYTVSVPANIHRIRLDCTFGPGPSEAGNTYFVRFTAADNAGHTSAPSVAVDVNHP